MASFGNYDVNEPFKQELANLKQPKSEGSKLEEVVAKEKKASGIRKTAEYQQAYQNHIKFLKSLNEIDSNPNDGRVDISIFNAHIGKYSETDYEAVSTKEAVFDANRLVNEEVERNSVNIEQQALSMADKDFGI